jgi:hypothetical protein
VTRFFSTFLLFHHKNERRIEQENLSGEDWKRCSNPRQERVRARDFNLIVGNVSKEEEENIHMKEHAVSSTTGKALSLRLRPPNRNFLRPS